MDKNKIKKAVKDILTAIGENPNREGLKDTPSRIANMYEEIFKGIKKDPLKEIKTFYEDKHEEMIFVKDIPLYSMCEHHLLPFLGKAHVVYIPTKGKICGLSKIARVVDIVSKKPQLQERMTSEIADTLLKGLGAKGVLVVIEAEHLCISMRGINKPGSKTTTSAIRGVFSKNATTRQEALTLIK
jgi:GTP cyclohydrolase I